MQGIKKQAKNTSNNSDFSNFLLETRIKEARNTSNNDFSYSLIFFSLFFCTVHFFFRRYCSLFFDQFFFSLLLLTIFFLDVEQTLNYNLEFEERKKMKQRLQE